MLEKKKIFSNIYWKSLDDGANEIGHFWMIIMIMVFVLGQINGCAELPLRWEFTEQIRSDSQFGDVAVRACFCQRDHRTV